MAPGTYVGTGNVNLNLASKRIVLTTADGPSNTIIDGQDIFGSKGLEVSSGEDTTAVVSGYTFTRFNSNYGGAIRCDGSSPRIENNRFIDNHATDGGAIYATSGSIKIRNNEFFANDAYRGGAIFIFGFTSNGPEIIGNWIDSCWSQSEGGGVYLQNIATGVSIRRNVFSRNVCGGLGGAVMLATAHNVLIHNNTFDLNSAEQGGAIEVLSSSSVGIRNNIIARSSQGFGIYIYSGGVGNYNCLFQNLPDHYGGEQSPSTSDIIGDPFFYMAPPTYYGIRANSPCIDAGDPDPTFDDADGSRSDIGALPYDGKLEFELVSPVGDTVVPTYFPYFVWHALPDTTAFGKFYYQVIWSSTQAFLLADSSALSSDSFWLSTLPFAASTKWYWKVVAESDFGVLVNSWQAGHFEIDGHPSTPQVLSPPDSAEVMLLDWLICSEAIDPDTDDSIWYNFQFDSSSLFNSIAVDVSIRSDSMGLLNLNERVDITGAPVATVFLGASLNDDTYYYWRVRAIDSHGGMSEFSVPTLSIFLNLQNTDPFAVDSVLSPQDGESVNSLTPTLAWYASSDPDLSDDAAHLRYFVQVDDNPDFAGPYVKSYWTAFGQPSIEVDSLSDETHHYYRIQTADDEGAVSTWSPTYDFWTNWQNDFPTNFSLVLPPNNKLSVGIIPQFSWQQAVDTDPLDAVSYTLVLALDPGFLFKVEFPGIADTIFSLASPLSYSEDYWWKVKAVDLYEGTTWSLQTYRFKTLLPGDVDGNAIVNIADVVFLINYIFASGPPPDSHTSTDADCSGRIDIVDAVYLINYIFASGAPPCEL